VSKQKIPPKPWPKLSETLDGPGHPQACRSCGTSTGLSMWQECDEADQPTPIYLPLCEPCSDRIIEPHPRLYSRRDPKEPMPGVMLICVDCELRTGNRCTSPLAKFNGGGGMTVATSPLGNAHVCGRDKNGKRFGRFMTMYDKPPHDCSGRRPSAEVSL
jgi:hypothetical protein